MQPPSERKPVPRIGRVLDLVGLSLFLTGGAIWARAWFGFRGIPTYERPSGGTVFATVELADGFRQLQRVGVTLMLVGIAVFVLAWWVARRVQRAEAG